MWLNQEVMTDVNKLTNDVCFKREPPELLSLDLEFLPFLDVLFESCGTLKALTD